ncbi:hypothetical protein [Ralstonia solanacearum]|uniref:hypothetical protein n=1 Tax=Ralstonia solanacearum TaxID=305 RepID=UPI0018D05188|nr:hypothetical protein [Ralstonia solanacearum]
MRAVSLANSPAICSHSALALGLRLHRRAQGIALRFRPSLVRAHLTQLRDLALLDDQRLVGPSDFHLQLWDLLLVPARTLVALFLAGVAEVLQCLVRVLQLLL